MHLLLNARVEVNEDAQVALVQKVQSRIILENYIEKVKEPKEFVAREEIVRRVVRLYFAFDLF